MQTVDPFPVKQLYTERRIGQSALWMIGPAEMDSIISEDAWGADVFA